ncbi:MAG: FISUMP domain-containing protein [Candidatus Saccharibacteria bacterium]|nr:FISUMP domain-containing protein [Candidatus Saccharibacteria bacterium]
MKTNKVISYIKQHNITNGFSYIRKHNLAGKAYFSSIILFSLLALAVIFPLSKGEQTTEAVDGTTSTTDPSLSIVFSSTTASVDLTVKDENGTFASSDYTNSNIEFSVQTDSYAGYNLSLSSDRGTDLVGVNVVNKIVQLDHSIFIDEFSNPNNTQYNNRWGISCSSDSPSSLGFCSLEYIPFPTYSLDSTSAANSTPYHYTLAIGVRADYETLVDTYTNTFDVQVTINPIQYSITYNSNTADTVTNLPTFQSGFTPNSNINLSTETPAREGYNFLGWCTVAPSSSTPDACSGSTYEPSATYYLGQTSPNVITLYAMWEKAVVYMQDYTLARCQEEATNAAAILTDIRDGNTYTVRYIEGNCWMTQNLGLAGGMTITSDDSNIATNADGSVVAYTLPVSTGGTGETAWTNSYTAGYMHEPTEAELTALSNKGINAAQAGYYYNYYTATAGTITGSSNSTAATYGICPKGWKLPTGLSGGEQQKLTPAGWRTDDKTYSHSNINDNTTAGKGSFSPVAAGLYNGGSLGSVGSGGVWWSSSAGSTTGRYSLSYLPSNGLYSGYNGYRVYGLAIRCVLSS